MARVDEETFHDRDVELIFIAGNNREARKVEALLTDHAVDYLTTLEPFLHRGLFGTSTLTGIGFLVLSGQAPFCRDLLEKSGLRTGLVDAEP